MLKIELLDFESTEIDAYNQRQTAIQSELDALPDRQAALVTAAASEPVAKLRSESALLAGKPFELQRQAVQLAEAEGIACHEVLAKLAADSLKAAEVAHKKATEQAEKALAKAGVSAESDPTFGVNPEGARIRLNGTVRSCEAVRAAQLLVDQAREDQIQVKKNASQWCDDLAHAKSEWRTMVRGLFGV